jgi:hypothetical protein
MLTAVLLGGCVTQIPPHVPLPDVAKDRFASTDVVLPIRQGEIYVFVPNSNVAAATGGGLLGALVDVAVDSVRTSKAEAAVKPLRDATSDFDFDSLLRDDLRTSLSQIAWLHTGSARVVRNVSPDGLDAALAGSSASAVLFATTDYRLDNDGNVLDVSLSVDLIPKDAALMALRTGAKSGHAVQPANAIYRDTLTVETTPPAAADRDHYIAAWSANHGASLRQALTMAAHKLSDMLAADLQQQEIAADADGSATRTALGTVVYTAKPPF